MQTIQLSDIYISSQTDVDWYSMLQCEEDWSVCMYVCLWTGMTAGIVVSADPPLNLVSGVTAHTTLVWTLITPHTHTS